MLFVQNDVSRQAAEKAEPVRLYSYPETKFFKYSVFGRKKVLVLGNNFLERKYYENKKLLITEYLH